jgi:hypothetical protein
VIPHNDIVEDIVCRLIGLLLDENLEYDFTVRSDDDGAYAFFLEASVH